MSTPYNEALGATLIERTKREQIVNPRPVPPYLRVVEPSACRNDSKISCRLSAGMPMPAEKSNTKRSMSCRAARRAMASTPGVEARIAGLASYLTARDDPADLPAVPAGIVRHHAIMKPIEIETAAVHLFKIVTLDNRAIHLALGAHSGR